MFNIFPSSAEEAVAMLYVQRQDLTGKSPSEIYTMFQETYYEVRKDRREKQKSGWFKDKKDDLQV